MLADILIQRNEDLCFPFLQIQPAGSKPPFFFLHGDYLSGGFYCLELARHLGPDQPFYALPPYGLDNQPVPVLGLNDRPLHSLATQLAKVWNNPAQLAHLFRSTEFGRVGGTRATGTDVEGETARARRERVRKTYLRIDRRYIPGEYAHPVALFWAEDDPEPAEEAARRWRTVAPQVDLHVIPGTHLDSLTQNVKGLAAHLMRCLG